MFKFLQTIMGKHRRGMLALLLLVIVVPFVFTIGNMPGIGYKRKRGRELVLGYDLGDPKVVESVIRDAAISQSLQGKSLDLGDIQNYSLTRLLCLHHARHLKVPVPTEEVLQSFIRTRSAFWNERGEFDAAIYNDFVKKWPTRQDDIGSLRRVLEEDFMGEMVGRALEGPGWVLGKEMEWWYERAQTSYTVQWVEFPLEKVSSDFTVTADELLSFYEKNKENYRVDHRVEVVLLTFDPQRHRSSVPEPSRAELEAYFESHKDLFKETTLGEENLSRVSECWIEEQSGIRAEKAVSDCTFELYEKKIRPTSPEWEVCIQRYGAEGMVVPPYSRHEVPSLPNVEAARLMQAWDLDEEHFLSEPFGNRSKWQVLALKCFHEAYDPDFREVKDRVGTDLRWERRREILLERVRQMRREMGEVGKSLEDFASGETVQSLPASTFNGLLGSLMGKFGWQATAEILKEIEGAPEGAFLEPKLTENGVVWVKLCGKQIPSVDTASKEFAAFSESYRHQMEDHQRSHFVSELLEKALVSPGSRP
jgi:hypothetical protein